MHAEVDTKSKPQGDNHHQDSKLRLEIVGDKISDNAVSCVVKSSYIRACSTLYVGWSADYGCYHHEPG